MGSIQAIREPRCKKCGRPLEDDILEYCKNCVEVPHHFEEGIAIFEYDEHMKESLLKVKFGGRREYLRFFGEGCVQNAGAQIREWGIQGIIPVPMHPDKVRRRGFNQAEILADYIGGKLGIPVYKKSLQKVKNTKEQKTLSGTERKKNLKDAFRGAEGEWGLKSILVVDDIYTTGSTIDAVCAEIRKHGVDKIYFLSVFMA